jgi:molecular chaperone GrpE
VSSNQDSNSSNNSNSDISDSNAHQATVTDLGAETSKLLEEVDKFKNDYLYLKAEFENYKRHSIKERSELLKFGAERFIRDLLGVLDNFERAMQMKVTQENFQTFVKGVDLTSSELKSLLTKHSVIEIPSEGQPFDPNIHEALSAEPTDKMPAGHVLRVFQKPYKFHDKVIRPGQVVVAKKNDAN